MLGEQWRRAAGGAAEGGEASSSSSSSDGSSSSSSSESEGEGKADIDADAAPVSSFEDLWAIMKKVHEATVSSAALSATGEPHAERVGGFRWAAGAKESKGGVMNGASAWEQYSAALSDRQHAAVEATALGALGVKPYEDARPILRFKQTFVLGEL